MAAIWQQENKRRAARVRLGKTGTLKDGRCPGEYPRLGYTVRRELGRRGVEINLGDIREVETVRLVFGWYAAGCTLQMIRGRLVASGAAQKDRAKRWEWNSAVLSEMLAAEDYTGRATWHFGDGTSLTISIPPIISQEQWAQAQKRRTDNIRLSVRNAGEPYLLQGLLHCGDCGGLVSQAKIKYFYKRMASDGMKRYDNLTARHEYRCAIRARHTDAAHAQPYRHPGEALDWRVWRAVVDKGIKHPELILEQVRARQAQLQGERSSFEGAIAEARNKLAAIDAERADYQRQKGRQKITEKEFDDRMDETAQSREYWQGEIARLKELRDDAVKIKAGMDYAVKLMAAIEKKLPEIDQTPAELRAMPEAQRRAIIKRRQTIIRALVDKITTWASGRLVVEGLIDGAKGEQFGLVVS
jgi:Recombinase